MSYLFLSVLLVVISLLNYNSGTFLIGWDNLLPELNIFLNLKRSLFAVWQEYQGLGLVGGMGHATDLIRQLLLLPFVLTIPDHLIRYLWHFSMMAAGTFGVYHGLKKLKFTTLSSFFSALFYLLNFGTIQYFWTPLETFSSFWGCFPWLIFSLWSYLKTPTRKNIVVLMAINLLAIPGFYVQTLFAVYLICISIVLFSWTVLSTSALKTKAITITKTLLIIFALNSFWILPQAYFLKTNLKNPTSGIGNFMANEDTFNRNERRGYISDLAILKGYYYDFPANYGPLMGPWTSHFSNFYILACGYLIAVFAIIGLASLLYKYRKLSFTELTLILFSLLTITVLLSSTPPFNFINSLFRSIPVINQIFRSPFTKFIVPAIFTYTLLVAYSLRLIETKLHSVFPYIIFAPLLLIFSFPVFKGNFISPHMRRSIPEQYRRVFDYFNQVSPTARIANLPQGSFWGWTNYNWGLSGSGFIWYGIKQPIMDRAFDAWNLKNEQYYWELTNALQSGNASKLENIFKKYSIEYIIFDKSVHFPDDIIFDKLSLSTASLLESMESLNLVKTEGNINIYQFNSSSSPYLLTNPPSANHFNFAIQDSIYNNLGDYIVKTDPEFNFPHVSLFTNRLQSEIDSELKTYPDTYGDPPDLGKNHSTAPHPERQDYYLSNTLNNSLLVFNFPKAELSQSYLAKVEHKHISGKPLEISAVSENRQNYYFHTILDKSSGWTNSYFIIPARETENFNQGINIIFNNSSANHRPTTNIIKDVNLFPFPLESLQNRYTSDATFHTSTRQYLKSASNIFYHTVDTPTFGSPSTIVLPQSFDNGWLAFYTKGSRINFLKNHVLVNNWANGWDLPVDSISKIYIVFWPQILEFIGLLLIPICFIYVSRMPHTTSNPL